MKILQSACYIGNHFKNIFQCFWLVSASLLLHLFAQSINLYPFQKFCHLFLNNIWHCMTLIHFFAISELWNQKIGIDKINTFISMLMQLTKFITLKKLNKEFLWGHEDKIDLAFYLLVTWVKLRVYLTQKSSGPWILASSLKILICFPFKIVEN